MHSAATRRSLLHFSSREYCSLPYLPADDRSYPRRRTPERSSASRRRRLTATAAANPTAAPARCATAETFEKPATCRHAPKSCSAIHIVDERLARLVPPYAHPQRAFTDEDLHGIGSDACQPAGVLLEAKRPEFFEYAIGHDSPQSPDIRGRLRPKTE